MYCDLCNLAHGPEVVHDDILTVYQSLRCRADIADRCRVRDDIPHTVHRDMSGNPLPSPAQMLPDHDGTGRACALAGRAADGHTVAASDICLPCYIDAIASQRRSQS